MLNSLKALCKQPFFMKYFTNTSWLFAEKILRMAVGLFVGIWVARYLGPERFGLFSYALSFVALFAAIASLGINDIVVKELVQDESRSRELLGTAVFLKLIGALLMLIAIAIAINFTSGDSYTNTLIFVIASAAIFQSFNAIDLYFQAKVLSRYVVFANSISLLISSTIKIGLILYQAPLMAFACVVVFDSFVLACGFIYFFTRHADFQIRHLRFNWSMSSGLLRRGWPLILSGVVISIYMKIDQVMIKEIMGSGAVGQYAAAVKLSEAWYFIPVVITSSLFPSLINTKKNNQNLYHARLQSLYTLMVWVALAIAIPMSFLSDWIVELLYGGHYSQAGGVLMIHIWAGIFVFLGVASGKWIINENLQIFSTINTSIGAIINIVLNYVLITKFGIKGAAWSTLISYFVAAYLGQLFFRKTRVNFFRLSRSLFLMKNLNVKKPD